MCVKYHDHVLKEMGERKKAPSSFDFVLLFCLKTNSRSNKLEAKKYQSQLSRPWSSCCYYPLASMWNHRRSYGQPTAVQHSTVSGGMVLLCVETPLRITPSSTASDIAQIKGEGAEHTSMSTPAETMLTETQRRWGSYSTSNVYYDCKPQFWIPAVYGQSPEENNK